jgi:peptide deformylase
MAQAPAARFLAPSWRPGAHDFGNRADGYKRHGVSGAKRVPSTVEPTRRARYMAPMSADAMTAAPAASAPLPDPTAVDPLPILIVPHPALRARARAVGPDDMERVRALLPRMFSAMYRAPGIGLAAPQVGELLRAIIVDLAPDNVRTPIALINPEVVAASTDLATREEGCLSLPGQYADVTRPALVRVRYLDEAGTRREIGAEGLLAACLQHEIDHLDGVLFVDHVSALKRNMILRKLAKEQRQKGR